MRLGLYRHYKGNDYQVLGLARHSETLEELIVYQALYGDYGMWVRPKSMFLEQVEFKGKIVGRFEYIQDNFTVAPQINKSVESSDII